jgi:hypothetical protein
MNSILQLLIPPLTIMIVKVCCQCKHPALYSKSSAQSFCSPPSCKVTKPNILHWTNNPFLLSQLTHKLPELIETSRNFCSIFCTILLAVLNLWVSVSQIGIDILM